MSVPLTYCGLNLSQKQLSNIFLEKNADNKENVQATISSWLGSVVVRALDLCASLTPGCALPG